jgi:hypothetical protein
MTTEPLLEANMLDLQAPSTILSQTVRRQNEVTAYTRGHAGDVQV